MDQLELIRPGKTNEAAAKEYLEVHIRNGETALQGCGGLAAAKSYDEWLDKIHNGPNGEICFAQFFAVRKKDEKLIGVMNVRHPYQGYVQKHGHIGYGVKPSERKRGYATAMLRMALEYGREIGLKNVLLTCDKPILPWRR